MSEISESINDFLSLQGLDLTKHVFNHNSLSNFLIECRDEIEKLEAALRYYAKEYENPFGGDDSLIARKALEGKDD